MGRLKLEKTKTRVRRVDNDHVAFPYDNHGASNEMILGYMHVDIFSDVFGCDVYEDYIEPLGIDEEVILEINVKKIEGE